MSTPNILRIAILAHKPQLAINRQPNFLGRIIPQIGPDIGKRPPNIPHIHPPGHVGIFKFDTFVGECFLQMLQGLTYYLFVGVGRQELFCVACRQVAAEDVGVRVGVGVGVGFGAGEIGEVGEFTFCV